MAVPDADYGMAAIEIEVFLPLIVPYFASLSFHDGYGEEGIYIK